MNCGFEPNSTVIPGVNFGQFLYTLFLLFFHLPACIIRALRWESAQYLALGLALFGVAICIQSYLSTGLEAGEVLVWMPLTLMLDIGAIMQIVVRIIEKYKSQPLQGNQPDEERVMESCIPNCLLSLPRRHHRADRRVGTTPDSDLLAHLLICLAAFTLVLALCSPSFRDFAIAVTTGNYKKYKITNSSCNSIGCISLPARQQRDWLTGTIVGLGAALVLEALGMALISCARGRRFRVVEMQRPWFTMFGGTLMLVILIVFGVFNALRLPAGITDIVWIYHKEPRATVGRVCQVKLKASGLRGMIIG
ncbi:hypothetical protein DER46DRAFT_627641 [Fusarium sp. MPI-SDFR-AT-0072]|nr:hypothetical protein DER46DRAFT_627641 [Fusarium sp. MPI-SDFR-AT-0072]